MKKKCKAHTQTKFFNEAVEDCYKELPPRDELERILPLQNIPEMQEYLLHEYGYSWAEYRTNSREKLIDYIEKNSYEVIQILFERNYDSLYDFRIIVRK